MLSVENERRDLQESWKCILLISLLLRSWYVVSQSHVPQPFYFYIGHLLQPDQTREQTSLHGEHKHNVVSGHNSFSVAANKKSSGASTAFVPVPISIASRELVVHQGLT